MKKASSDSTSSDACSGVFCIFWTFERARCDGIIFIKKKAKKCRQINPDSNLSVRMLERIAGHLGKKLEVRLV